MTKMDASISSLKSTIMTVPDMQTMHQVEWQAVLLRLTQTMHQTQSMDQMLDLVAHETRQVLQVSRVALYRLLPDDACLVMVESRLDNEIPLPQPPLRDPSLNLETLKERYQQGHPRAVPSLMLEERPVTQQRFLSEHHISSVLVIPIVQSDLLWGFLVVHHHCPRRWLSEEVGLLQQIGIQIGVALKQMTLYQQVQRLNHELERQVRKRTAQLQLAFECEATLKRITDRVRDSLDEHQILQTAVEELAMGLGVQSCNAALFDLTQQTSRICYEYTSMVQPSQGRVSQMANFPELYRQILAGITFQFCSLVAHPARGQVSMLVCPISDERGVLGDLWLINHSYYRFSDQDIRLVQQVANQCAIAIRQARLYQASQNQVQALERLNRLKDDFLSSISHELRTPMTTMKMALQMLGVSLSQEVGLFSELSKPPSEQSRSARYFQILHRECDREIKLISDLLDLQEPTTYQALPPLVTIQAQDWFTVLVEPFQERFQAHHQCFQLEVPTHLPSFVCRADILNRIMTELLNNACKHSPAHETITLGISQMGDRLFIRVSNSGIEIPQDELPCIFDKFYRVPSADPWKQGGVGLGLALVQKLVHQMDGKIYVDSQPQLTSFTVELPFHPSEQRPTLSQSELR
jgi:signal transduction histidine kinase